MATSKYKGYTNAQAKAHKAYMSKTATITLTLSHEERERIKQRAAALGCPSVNKYILGLVRSDLDAAEGAGD